MTIVNHKYFDSYFVLAKLNEVNSSSLLEFKNSFNESFDHF